MQDITIRIVVNGDQLTVLDQAGNKLEDLGASAAKAGGAGGFGSLVQGAADAVQGIQYMTGAVDKAVGMVMEFNDLGTNVIRTDKALSAMSGGNAPQFMDAMRAKTHGLVDDLTLAHNATVALDTGVARTPEAMAKIAEEGSTLAMVMKGAADGGATLIQILEQPGMTRGLKQLGIEIEPVKLKFAELKKEGVDAATAWNEAVMGGVDRSFKQLGSDIESGPGTAVERLNVQIQDLKESAGKNIAIGIEGIVDLGTAVSQHFDVAVKNVGEGIQKAVTGSIDNAAAVDIAKINDARDQAINAINIVGKSSNAPSGVDTSDWGQRTRVMTPSESEFRKQSTGPSITDLLATGAIKTDLVDPTERFMAMLQKGSDIIAAIKYDMLIANMDAANKKQADINELIKQEGIQRAANADIVRSEINMVSGSPDYRSFLYGGTTDPGRAQQRQNMRDVQASAGMEPVNTTFGGRYALPKYSAGDFQQGGGEADMRGMVAATQNFNGTAADFDFHLQSMSNSVGKFVANTSLAGTFKTGSANPDYNPITGEVGNGLSADAASARAALQKADDAKYGRGSKKTTADLANFDRTTKQAVDEWDIATGQATPTSIKFGDAVAAIHANMASGKTSMQEGTKELLAYAQAAEQGKTSMADLIKLQQGSLGAGGDYTQGHAGGQYFHHGKEVGAGPDKPATPAQSPLQQALGDITTFKKGLGDVATDANIMQIKASQSFTDIGAHANQATPAVQQAGLNQAAAFTPVNTAISTTMSFIDKLKTSLGSWTGTYTATLVTSYAPGGGAGGAGSQGGGGPGGP